MTTGPRGGRGRVPDALVLVASSRLAESLRRVQESGWVGPVVVVGDAAEASALARGLGPGPPRAQSQPGSSGAEQQRRASHPARHTGPPRPELVLDPDRQLVASGGRQVHLSPLEYAVLHALLVRPGRICRYAELTERVWGAEHVGDTAQVHSVVKRVRRKLDEIASPVQVQVVHRVGFRAVAQAVTSSPGGDAPVSGHDQVKGG